MHLKFITSNQHKFEEIRAKVSPYNIAINHMEMKYGEPQADRIIDIARASMANLIPVVDGNFFIEDSGIEVDALNLFPGPYSSFVYQTIGWEGILKLMEGEEHRAARFRSVIALYLDGDVHLFQGVTEGSIANEGRGTSGFGFDPVFIPSSANVTYGEMEMDLKNTHSHRSKAFDKMMSFLVELQ